MYGGHIYFIRIKKESLNLTFKLLIKPPMKIKKWIIKE